MLDVEALLQAIPIPYTVSSGGWLTIRCPLCDDHSEHGGIKQGTGGYHCWRCGSHPLSRVLQALVGSRANELLRRFGGSGRPGLVHRPRITYSQRLETPGSATPSRYHLQYLTKRGFSAETAEKYGLRYTGPGETFHGQELGNRLVIPLLDADGTAISWQARSISPLEKIRYKVCPLNRSLTHYKNTLYAEHLVPTKTTVGVVEGIFDQWRLGDGFVATYGTSVTKTQILRLSQWQRVCVVFDPGEEAAQNHAAALCSQLSALGCKAIRIDLGDLGGRDPAELTQDEVAEVRAAVFAG